jgi:hypothetical protein
MRGVDKREKMVREKRVGKRVSSYHPSRVCLIVLTSKLKLQMMVRMGGNVGGVVKFLYQGMHRGHFDMC